MFVSGLSAATTKMIFSFQKICTDVRFDLPLPI